MRATLGRALAGLRSRDTFDVSSDNREDGASWRALVIRFFGVILLLLSGQRTIEQVFRLLGSQVETLQFARNGA